MINTNRNQGTALLYWVKAQSYLGSGLSFIFVCADIWQRSHHVEFFEWLLVTSSDTWCGVYSWSHVDPWFCWDWAGLLLSPIPCHIYVNQPISIYNVYHIIRTRYTERYAQTSMWFWSVGLVCVFSLLQITVVLHDNVLVSAVYCFVLTLHGISFMHCYWNYKYICDLALFFFCTDISRMLIISSCAHISAS